LSRLNKADRERWWKKIKDEAPELVELLQNPVVVKLRTELKGDVIIRIDDNGKILKNGEY